MGRYCSRPRRRRNEELHTRAAAVPATLPAPSGAGAADWSVVFELRWLAHPGNTAAASAADLAARLSRATLAVAIVVVVVRPRRRVRTPPAPPYNAALRTAAQ